MFSPSRYYYTLLLFIIGQILLLVNSGIANDCAERINFTYSSGTIKLFLDAENVSGSSVQWSFPEENNRVFAQFSRIAIPFSELPDPCESKLVAVRYRNTTTNEWIDCERRIYFCAPFTCSEVITDSYQIEENAFRLTLQQAVFDPSKPLQWVNDETNQELGTGTEILLPAMESCRRIPICVRYFDLTTDSWRICCRSLPFCPPEDCSTLISCNETINDCDYIEAEFTTAADDNLIAYNFSASTLPGGYDFCKWEIYQDDTNELLTTSGTFNFDYVFAETGTYEVQLFYLNPNENCQQTCIRTVTVTAPDFSFQGRIYRHTESIGIPDVMVNVAGTTNLESITDGEGYYQISDLHGVGSFEIQPQKDTLPLQGISLIDAVLLQQYLSENYELNPYQIIAADLNNSLTIDAADLAELQQIFTQSSTRLSENVAWRFIPADYEFPTRLFPLAVPFPETLSYDYLTTEMKEEDFIGVKIGDINDGQSLPTAADSFHLQLSEATALVATNCAITLSSNHAMELTGGMLPVSWDTTFLELINVIPLVEEAAFFQSEINNEGIVKLIWLPAETIIIEANEPLVELQFRTRQAGMTSVKLLTEESEIINGDIEQIILNANTSEINIRPADLSVRYETNHVSCTNEADGSIALRIDGTTSIYNIEWSNGQRLNNVNANFIVLSNLSAGQYAATITDTETGGTAQINNIQIIEPTPLSIDTLVQMHISCGGVADGIIEVTSSGGTPPYQYQWNQGDTTNLLTNLMGGNYQLSLQDANGCQTVAPFILNEPPPLSANIETLNVSFGTANGRATITAMGGLPPYQYRWSHDANLETNVADELAVGDYSVTTIDANNCSQTIEFVIEQTVAVQEDVLLNQLQIYPQPATDYLYVQFPETPFSIEYIEVFQFNGQRLNHQPTSQLIQGQLQIPLALPTGMYLLKIATGHDFYCQKFVIQ